VNFYGESSCGAWNEAKIVLAQLILDKFRLTKQRIILISDYLVDEMELQNDSANAEKIVHYPISQSGASFIIQPN
jgi:hypothetical protein